MQENEHMAVNVAERGNIAIERRCVTRPTAAYCSSNYPSLKYMYLIIHIFIHLIVCAWTLRAVGRKHLESFEMWCWRRMEKISWTDHVRNEEVLLRGKEQRNILHEISKRKANWIGHILRRNCLLQQVIEGKMKGGI
jgi:hypothetical protein